MPAQSLAGPTWLDRTDYPADRARGWPIGSGMTESTAKRLVGLRLKGPGMHWSEAGAPAVTALLARTSTVAGTKSGPTSY